MSRDAAIATFSSAWRWTGLPHYGLPLLTMSRATIASFASTTQFRRTRTAVFHERACMAICAIFWTARCHGTSGLVAFCRPLPMLTILTRPWRRHCRETTLIMRAFAKEWLGKNRFYLEKDISRGDAAAFAAHAFTKIRAELHNRKQSGSSMKRFTFILAVGCRLPRSSRTKHVLLMDVAGPSPQRQSAGVRHQPVDDEQPARPPARSPGDCSLRLLRRSTRIARQRKAFACWSHVQREMAFVIPVRCWEVWAGADLTAALVETLSFLSDDRYSFEFVRSPSPMAERETLTSTISLDGRFETRRRGPLFGGVDSLAGAVEEHCRLWKNGPLLVGTPLRAKGGEYSKTNSSQS